MNIIQSFPNFRARPWLATRRLFIFTPDGRDRYCPLPRSLASLLFLFPLSSFSPFPRDIRLRKSAQKRREEEGAANEIKAQNDAVCRRHPAPAAPYQYYPSTEVAKCGLCSARLAYTLTSGSWHFRFRPPDSTPERERN